MLTAHLGWLRGLFRPSIELAFLPVACVRFRSEAAPENIRSVYDYFTKPRPRYKVFKNKSRGAALIDLRTFGTGGRFHQLTTCVGKSGGRTTAGDGARILLSAHRSKSLRRRDSNN